MKNRFMSLIAVSLACASFAFASLGHAEAAPPGFSAPPATALVTPYTVTANAIAAAPLELAAIADPAMQVTGVMEPVEPTFVPCLQETLDRGAVLQRSRAMGNFSPHTSG